MSQDDEVPPYQFQQLIATALEGSWGSSGTRPIVTCAQALGPEIYVGCSNGELLRYALQGQDAVSPGSYSLLSRQSLPSSKPIDELILVPSISRILILSDRQLFFYTLPALDMVPSNVIKPIRNVVGIAVDEQHVRRPAPRDAAQQGEPIDFCIIKRSSVALFSLRDKLWFQKDIPLPSGITLARRTGRCLCVADHENYNVIDLDAGLLFPVLPLSQVPDSPPVKPCMTVIGENEFLLLSWTGASTIGIFVTGDGDPIRGTLEWPNHPKLVAFDSPHLTSLLPDNSIQIHNVETQVLVQTVPAPADPFDALKLLVSCAGGFFVPSMQRKEKLRPVAVKLKRGTPISEEAKEIPEPKEVTGGEKMEEETEAEGVVPEEREEPGDDDEVEEEEEGEEEEGETMKEEVETKPKEETKDMGEIEAEEKTAEEEIAEDIPAL